MNSVTLWLQQYLPLCLRFMKRYYEIMNEWNEWVRIMISMYVELQHIQPLVFFLKIYFQLFEVFSPRKRLWLRSVKVWCLPNDMKVPQATHLLFLCTHFSMSKYCPWQQVLAIIPDSSMPLSVLQFRQRWHCKQWKIQRMVLPRAEVKSWLQKYAVGYIAIAGEEATRPLYLASEE